MGTRRGHVQGEISSYRDPQASGPPFASPVGHRPSGQLAIAHAPPRSAKAAPSGLAKQNTAKSG
jgi:hypothetical protein